MPVVTKRPLPTDLKHKPVLYFDDYDRVDGYYKGNTDTFYLSLGRAQWCGDDEFVASVKTWRSVNGKWSRESEETTLTRALDLALLVSEGYYRYVNGRINEPELSVFGRALRAQNATVDKEIAKGVEEFYKINQDDIKAHMRLLKSLLNKCNLD